MDIRFVDIKSDSTHLSDIKRLYNTAFPPAERAPFRLLVRGANKRRNVDFFACMDGNEWVGMLYVVNHLDLSYIFYLAVDDRQRGRGCGTAILKTAQEVYSGRRLFLAIEEIEEKYENYSERIKRLRFYENAGFARTEQKVQEADVIYDLMSINGPVKNKEYRDLIRSFVGFRMLFIPLKILND
jgi:GNAT superfamily N-acetyltransferase